MRAACAVCMCCELKRACAEFMLRTRDRPLEKVLEGALMESENKSLQYIDLIKGIALLMTVFCHLMAPCIGRVILTHLECIALACLFFFCRLFVQDRSYEG